MLGLAANKFDLFDSQQVTESQGQEYAEKIGAVFSCTSAKESIGIEPLFKQIGEKILEETNKSMFVDETMLKTYINYDDKNKKKKKCCK